MGMSCFFATVHDTQIKAETHTVVMHSRHALLFLKQLDILHEDSELEWHPRIHPAALVSLCQFSEAQEVVTNRAALKGRGTHVRRYHFTFFDPRRRSLSTKKRSRLSTNNNLRKHFSHSLSLTLCFFFWCFFFYCSLSFLWEFFFFFCITAVAIIFLSYSHLH